MIYHSVSIDSPVLPAPISAALFPDKESNTFNLVWNRQDGEKDLRAEATVTRQCAAATPDANPPLCRAKSYTLSD